MANKKKRKQLKAKTSEKKQWHPLSYEIVGILFIAYAIIIYFEYGVVGRWTQSIALFLFGNLHFVIPFLLVLSALIFMIKRKGVILKNRIVIGVLLIISGLAIFSHSLLFEELIQTKKLLSNSVLRETWRILIDHNGVQNRGHALGGGMSGALLFSILHVLFDATGAKIAAWVLLVIGTILVSGKTFFPFIIKKMPTIKSIWPQKRERVRKQKRMIASEEFEISATNHNIHDEEPIISAFTQQPAVIENDNKLESAIQESEDEIIVQNATHMRYVLPSTQLLESPPPHDQSREYSVIQTNAKKLEQTLHSFGVKAKVVQVHLGPAVTKYEVLPDVGVKVSKIVSLQDDLALALAAKDIRLEAPIPGKSAIGIEVPNNDIAIVTLREVIEVPENKLASKLLISFGRDVTGQAMLAELNKMPHLLVAGATGSGKSVCINGIIISILMRATPQEVRMMMIDPKMVELNVYNGIPHLLAPVVTDARKAAQALQKIVSEMERRYDLFSHTGTRNIEGYNDYIEQHNKEKEEKQLKLPYIVVIVDELADLMMIASNEVEDAITRLAQMARAAGIHLIIATQRPSVDVITGIIKANIPSRIAFSVSSSVDSRTILDMGGAEKLLGRGDMLFLPAGASKPVRVQGAFVSDQEVEKVVDFVIQQQKAKYEEAMIVNESTVATVNDEKDDLYDEAISLIIEQQSASISMLQRRLRIGYARAARIVDQMEARGVVGPADGSRPRQVYTEKIMALQDA